jgi:uncharacterized protein YeaO (DUF488 family)
MAKPKIALKRVYEPPSDDDGLRILVERLWPRGVSKAKAKIDHWVKGIAPSLGLRVWYRHEIEKWPEFKKRYRAELKKNAEAVDELRALCAAKKVSFIFAAKDEDHNSAVVLREFLLGKAK